MFSGSRLFPALFALGQPSVVATALVRGAAFMLPTAVVPLLDHSLSSHSLRHGLASTLMALGCPLHIVQAWGRWSKKSNAIDRYVDIGGIRRALACPDVGISVNTIHTQGVPVVSREFAACFEFLVALGHRHPDAALSFGITTSELPSPLLLASLLPQLICISSSQLPLLNRLEGGLPQPLQIADFPPELEDSLPIEEVPEPAL